MFGLPVFMYTCTYLLLGVWAPHKLLLGPVPLKGQVLGFFLCHAHQFLDHLNRSKLVVVACEAIAQAERPKRSR